MTLDKQTLNHSDTMDIVTNGHSMWTYCWMAVSFVCLCFTGLFSTRIATVPVYGSGDETMQVLEQVWSWKSSLMLSLAVIALVLGCISLWHDRHRLGDDNAASQS